MNRRTLLRGAGGVALGLPLLEAMIGPSAVRSARAQAAAPRRLVVVYHNQGVLMDDWAPRGSRSAYTFGPILSPLEPFKEDILVLSGIDDESCLLDGATPHDRAGAHLLTGARMTGTSWRNAGGPSVDHAVSQRISPPDLPIRALHLGAPSPGIEVCFTGPGQPVDRIQSPTEAFDTLFGGLVPLGNEPLVGGESEAAKRRRLRQQSVLDAVKANVAEVNRRLSPQDRRVVDAYLTRVGEIERRIANQARDPASEACRPVRPVVDRSPLRARMEPRGFSPEHDVDVGSRAMVDVAVTALTCDLTRVVTLAYRQPNAYEWLVDARGQKIMSSDWHADVVHAGGGTREAPSGYRDWLFRVQQFYHRELAYLLERLKGTPEGDGTLLDSTLVLYVNELGDGARHGHSNKPCLIAGRAGGAIRPGRWIDAAGPHQRLLLSVLEAFDIEQAVFGDPRFCARGPFTGLS